MTTLAILFLAHESQRPKAQGALKALNSSRRPCMRPSVRLSIRVSTLSNINISETSWLIAIKFHL